MAHAPIAEAVIFDLEFTAWEGSQARKWTGPGEHREVIQIGALKVDAASGAERESFSRLVKPKANPVLSDYITALTGITNADLERNGMDFEEAYGAFLEFLGACPLFCYGWDEVVIALNVDLYGLKDRFDLLYTTNLHHFFAGVGVPVKATNSGLVAQTLGAEPPGEGAAHDALYDCRSLAAGVRHAIGLGHPSPFLAPEPKHGRDPVA